MDIHTKLEFIDKLITLRCHLEPFWRYNEAILNKGYFQHKMLHRSNACGLLQVSERQDGKPHWWNTADRQMFPLPWGEQLTGYNLGENSLAAGLGNEHLLGRPCEHYLCQCLCKKSLSLLWCGIWNENGVPLEKRDLITVSSPNFSGLYNSFLCHCMTFIIIMLPDSFSLPFYYMEVSLLKTEC